MTGSISHGRRTIYGGDGVWLYKENGQPADGSRPCPHCRRLPVPDSKSSTGTTRDGCLRHIGNIEGYGVVRGACCGHGNPKRAYLQFSGKAIFGEKAYELLRPFILETE